MGGIVSSNRNLLQQINEQDLKIVTLENANKKMRLYQHATTSEVLVLYDQQIGDYVGHRDVNMWHPLKLSERQGEYFKQCKIGVTVPNKNVNLMLQSPGPSSAIPSPIGSPAFSLPPLSKGGSKQPLLPPRGGSPVTSIANLTNTTASAGSSSQLYDSSRERGAKSPEFQEFIVDVPIGRGVRGGDDRFGGSDSPSPYRLRPIQGHHLEEMPTDDTNDHHQQMIDPLMKRVDRLRLAAMQHQHSHNRSRKGRGGESNEDDSKANKIHDNSNSMEESSQSSSTADSSRKSINAGRNDEINMKPTIPILNEFAKTKSKFTFRQYTPQIYSLKTTTIITASIADSKGEGGERDVGGGRGGMMLNLEDSSAYKEEEIDLRTRSIGETISISGSYHYFDDSKDEGGEGERSAERGGGERGKHKKSSLRSTSDTKSSSDSLRNSSGSSGSSTGSSYYSAGKIAKCSSCSREFYGFTAHETCEDHQLTCKLTHLMKLEFESLDSSLKVRTHSLEGKSDLLRVEDLEGQSKLSSINSSVIFDTTTSLINRVYEIHYDTADMYIIEQLLLAIDHALQIFDDSLASLHRQKPTQQREGDRRGNSSSGRSFQSEDNEDDNDDESTPSSHYKNQLLLYRESLLEAKEKCQEKYRIIKESSANHHLITSIHDFHLLKVIGKGGFGTVYLAKKPDSNRLYAIKAMNKDLIKKTKYSRQVKREQKVMTSTNRYPDYFVKLFHSFQDHDFLFLVMEYIPGGDCMTLLTFFKRFSELITQHFIAEVCVAIAHLHHYGVVHRDIKPDNIMITSRGHAKLGDFGLVTPYTFSTPSNSVASSNSYSYSYSRSINSNTSETNIRVEGKRNEPIKEKEGGGGGAGPMRLSNISSNNSKNSSKPFFNLTPVTSPNYQRWLESEDSSSSNHPHQHFSLLGAGGGEAEEEEESSNSSIHYSRPKIKKNRLASRVGNYNYVCPEIVLGEEYDHTVDWWAVMVLCFHFLTGVTPFEDENNDVKITMDNVFLHRANWGLLPEGVSNECKNFMSSVLSVSNSMERLGYESSQEILEHPFFYDIDFNTLFEKRGPLIPYLAPPRLSLTPPLPINNTTSSPVHSGEMSIINSGSGGGKSANNNNNSNTASPPSSTNSPRTATATPTPTPVVNNNNDSNANNSPSSGRNSRNSSHNIAEKIPIYTLLSKDEIYQLPNFGNNNNNTTSPEALGKNPGIAEKLPSFGGESKKASGFNSNNISSSMQIMENFQTASEFPNFTYFG